MFFTNLVGIALAAILTFFLLGANQKQHRKGFYAGTITIIIGGLAILTPLTINYTDAQSVTQFQKATYSKAAKVLVGAEDSPQIKDISIQGTEAVITLKPFPDNAAEIAKLTTELQRATGLQVLLQKSGKPS